MVMAIKPATRNPHAALVPMIILSCDDAFGWIEDGGDVLDGGSGETDCEEDVGAELNGTAVVLERFDELEAVEFVLVKDDVDVVAASELSVEESLRVELTTAEAGKAVGVEAAVALCDSEDCAPVVVAVRAQAKNAEDTPHPSEE